MQANFVCGELTCTGCGACIDSCPFYAIDMKEGALCGEPVPVVDASKCRDCGRCRMVCPISAPVELRMPLKTYAAWSNESNDVALSSSGGIATALARKVISEGGVVFGATSVDRAARCVSVERMAGLERLRGSKYVYSSPIGAYRNARKLLAAGKKVLFISTPCQIAALRSVVGDSHEGLTCVDLICHGTPPIALLREHLDCLVGRRWDSFSFRGRNDFHMCAYCGDKLVFDKPCFEDGYFSAFVAGIIHRDACYECPYARNQRTGDITLGDFWGLDKATLRSAPPGKVSVVLCNTQAGLDAIDGLPETVYREERSFGEADNAEQTNLHEPSPRTKDRSRFLKAYGRAGFDSAVRETWAWRRFRLRALKRKVLKFIGG